MLNICINNNTKLKDNYSIEKNRNQKIQFKLDFSIKIFKRLNKINYLKKLLKDLLISLIIGI